MHDVDHLAPQSARKLEDSSTHSLCLRPDSPPLPRAWHILCGPCLRRTLSLKHVAALGKGPSHGGENGLLRVGRSGRSPTSRCCRPFSPAESSRLRRKYPTRPGLVQGSRGRSTSGSGKKRALEGHQLEQTETEHSCRSGCMLSRCLPGTGPDSISAKEVLEIKAKSAQLHGHVQCPCRAVPQWSSPRRALSRASDDPRVP